jgi:hypothetical protein
LLAACGEVREIELSSDTGRNVSSLARGLSLNLQDVITPGTITYGGSGCPVDTVDAEVNEQGIDANFKALTIGDAKRRATCNIALPFSIGAGYQLGLTGLHLAATIDPFDPPRNATLRVSKFYPGTDGVVLETDWPPSAPMDDSSFTAQWSECGTSSIARWTVEVRSSEKAEVDVLWASLGLDVRPCE